MAPFLAQLPALNTSERALAVHLGHFPGDGRGRPTPATSAFASTAPTNAGRPDAGQPALARRTALAEPVSTDPRRRPGAETRVAAATPRRDNPPESAWSWSRGVVSPAQQPERTTTRAATAPSSPAETLIAQPTQAIAAATSADTDLPGQAATALPSTQGELQPGRAAESRPVQLADLAPSSAPSPTPPTEGLPASPPPAAEEVRSTSRLADVAAAIAALPDPEPATQTQRPSVQPAKREERTRMAATATATAKKTPSVPREPSRHWVQVAGGADKTALPRTFANLKTKAPKLLGGRTAWTVPLNATNRLLVGPFASTKEAQAFVNELAKSDLGAFAWTSGAGEKIDRLPAK